MLTPLTNVCASEYRIHDTEKANAILQKADVKTITDIFSESAYGSIPQLCKALKKNGGGIYTDILVDHVSKNDYDPVQFNENHTLADPEAYFSREREYTPELKELIIVVIERFAREMELVGTHELSVFMYRSKYNPSANMEYFQLDWHFDKGAKCTMISVLQNDFPYTEEGGGLDIAENQKEAPHNPRSFGESYPKDGYVCCSYPENGAILFHTHQGTILHRRSILGVPASPNATRTLFQIKLKDPDWHAI